MIATPVPPARTARRRRGDERGFVVPTTALLLVPLLVVAAFAVDLGGFYALDARMQRAADAAALAGVVWMPDEFTAANVARATAARNGFTHDPMGTGVTVSVDSPGERQLRVAISADGQLFLSRVFTDEVVIDASGTAEYVLPVPLGSPDNTLGNQSLTDTKNLWASISGPATAYVNGDAYSTRCAPSGCGTLNPEYRDSGYLYAIDVPTSAVGETLTVELFDAGHYQRPNYANVETADTGVVHTQYELFRADTTPLDASDNLLPANSTNGSCTTGPGRQYIAPESGAATYMNRWFTLCSITVSRAGQWFLQVKSSNIPGVTDAGDGWNQYSVRATLSGATQPQLAGYGDLSLFNNLPGRSGTFSATFYLAEVEAVHAGKVLRINLFDPGDGQSGTYDVNILRPGGSTTPCTYGARGGGITTVTSCSIVTRTGGTNQYNGQWLDIEIRIPSGYTCSTDCWWRVRYDFASVSSGNSPNDRTVWSAQIVGDPVHLIE
jgi:Flp pilus assembly protein TadG